VDGSLVWVYESLPQFGLESRAVGLEPRICGLEPHASGWSIVY